MPWTEKDVERHNKGLSAKKKKQWVAIANSIRSECLKKGGNEKDCDAKAVRIANGSVKNNMEYIKVNNVDQIEYIYEVKKIGGREYWVIPSVMIREGVHNGNRGPLLHMKEELAKSVLDWNGVPVTIYHPKVGDDYVSVNTDGIAEKWVIGEIQDAYMEDDKLRASIYLDVQKTTALAPEIIEMVKCSQIIEVSVGVFSEEEETVGVWNEENYVAINRNYIPDHLALLPGEVGACSVMDGCGIRVNKEGGEIMSNSDQKAIKLPDGAKLTKFVYSVEVEGDKSRFYECDVKLDEGVITIVGDPKEIVANNESSELSTNEKKEVKMCEPCKEKAEMLIVHSGTRFTEDDRAWLEVLTEDKLDKMIPKRAVVNTEKPEVTVDEAWGVIQANAKDDDFMEHLPTALKTQVESGLAVLEEKRNTLIKSIQDNTEKDVWSEDDLKGMDMSVLEKIEKSVNKGEEDYSGMGGGSTPQVNENVVSPMPLPGVEFDEN